MSGRPIDPQTGTVLTDSGGEFGPRLSRAQFLARDGADASPGVANGAFSTWTVRRSIGGEPFVVEATFDGEAILLLSLSLDPDGIPRGWHDWSEDREERRRVEHDRWLREACGIVPPIAGDWGRLESVFDRRTGWSLVSMAFVSAQPAD